MKSKYSSALAFLLSASASIANAADMDKHQDGLPELRATFSSAIGYSTNANDDVKSAEVDDYFNEDVISISAKHKFDELESKVEISGETRQFFDETDSSTWKAGIEAATTYEFTDDNSIGLEANYERENDAGDKAQEYGGRIISESKNNWAELRSTAGIAVEDARLPKGDVDNEFDEVKIRAATKIIGMPDNMWSPYVKGHSALIKPLENIAGIVDRRAIETGVGAGLRVKLGDFVEASLGGTYDMRNFKAAGVKTRDAAFIDAEIEWKPMDEFEVTGSIGQHFDAAGESASYVNEVREYEIAITAKPLDHFSNTATFKFEQEHEVGADEKSRKATITDRLTYSLHENLSVFAEGQHEWKRKNTAGVVEKKRNNVAMVGLEAEF